jgi:anti-sigma regulatory factor (Ser/Thr protein kinase)
MPDELALDLSLPRLKTAGGLARRAIREHFADGLGCERTDELSLVVTELVSNAVVHGQGAIKLAVRVDGDRVQGEVIDEGGGFEHEVRERGSEDFTGRGLSIAPRTSPAAACRLSPHCRTGGAFTRARPMCGSSLRYLTPLPGSPRRSLARTRRSDFSTRRLDPAPDQARTAPHKVAARRTHRLVGNGETISPCAAQGSRRRSSSPASLVRERQHY